MKSENIYTVLQQSILSRKPLIAPFLQKPPKGALEDRIAIYTDGYYGRLEETLLGDYGTLAKLLGEQGFSELCFAYVSAYPSLSFTLNALGKHLPKFLREVAPFNKKPFLSEIANYEWAQAEAFIAADAPLLTRNALATLTEAEWCNLRFQLHPACHLLTFHWNSFDIIESLKDNPMPIKSKKLKKSQSVLVFRRDYQPRYCFLNDLEYKMLTAIKNNATFMELCSLLAQEMDENQAIHAIVEKIHQWLHEQLFIL